MKKRRVAILGSTGSIGSQAIEVIASQPSLGVCALAAGNNWQLLGKQARQCRPEAVAMASPEGAEAFRSAWIAGDAPEVLSGPVSYTHLRAHET